LDVAYCASKHSYVRRMDTRLLTIAAFAKSGGEAFYSFVSPSDGLDLMDLCGLDRSLIRYL